MSDDRKPDDRPLPDPAGKAPWRVEGRRDAPDGRGGSLWRRPPGGRRFWIILIVLLSLNLFLSARFSGDDEPEPEITYSYFLEQVDARNVTKVTSQGITIQGAFANPTDPPGGRAREVDRFRTIRPGFAEQDDLLDRLLANDVVVSARPLDSSRPLWQVLFLGFGPTILLVALFVLLLRRVNGFGGIGKSKAKRYKPDTRRTQFSDVAGIDEAQGELVEIVDFLRNPERYSRLGGAIPRGVLLSGPPGTGKTLLARAVAGEADVPFFSLSASEFVEMVVGVGASRVRDLFAQAKAAAPAIIFIDELDAIGRARSSGGNLAGHDEREQTLNQILTEMDGFSGSEGVIVIAATNRPEILDQALLRPGRFDRRVIVNPPDQAGRRRILEVHTRSVPLDDSVDLDVLASTTAGMVGADLKNLVNEAALTAARRDRDRVAPADFSDAFEKIILGAERKITISFEERERTAYHEAGHALLGMLEPGADPVRKVSIVPRGRALGVTLQSPEADRYGYGSEYLYGRIVGALGGRAAEEIVFGEITSGAESDLEQVTRIARLMVGRWGMSEAIGPVSVLPGPADDPRLFPGAGAAAEATRELVDTEVRRIVDECYVRALAVLRKHRDKLEALARALLERESLDAPDAYSIVGLQDALESLEDEVVAREIAGASSNSDGPEPTPGSVLAEEQGQGLVDYALLLLLMAVACIAAARTLGLDIRELFDQVTAAWPV
jgi:cell division protease FtsH